MLQLPEDCVSNHLRGSGGRQAAGVGIAKEQEVSENFVRILLLLLPLLKELALLLLLGSLLQFKHLSFKQLMV